MKTTPLLALLLAAALAAPVAGATPAAHAWNEAFSAFDAADAQHKPAHGGVVFVGSSSIRLWSALERDFSQLPVVLNRGFGGSRMSDCAAHLQRLVLAYAPRTVVVYAGENDLAEGATPDEVLASVRQFVEGVRTRSPDTHIAYVSIKPSPLRQVLTPKIRQTNALVRQYIGQVDNAQFIDIYPLMLDSSGQPRGELYRDDRLHLNQDGYALWRRVIAARLP